MGFFLKKNKMSLIFWYTLWNWLLYWQINECNFSLLLCLIFPPPCHLGCILFTNLNTHTHLVFVYILYEGVSRILSCMFRNFTTISDFLIQHILKVFSNPLNWLTLRHLLQKMADCSKISDNMKKKNLRYLVVV